MKLWVLQQILSQLLLITRASLQNQFFTSTSLLKTMELSSYAKLLTKRSSRVLTMLSLYQLPVSYLLFTLCKKNLYVCKVLKSHFIFKTLILKKIKLEIEINNRYTRNRYILISHFASLVIQPINANCEENKASKNKTKKKLYFLPIFFIFDIINCSNTSLIFNTRQTKN